MAILISVHDHAQYCTILQRKLSIAGSVALVYICIAPLHINNTIYDERKTDACERSTVIRTYERTYIIYHGMDGRVMYVDSINVCNGAGGCIGDWLVHVCVRSTDVCGEGGGCAGGLG